MDDKELEARETKRDTSVAYGTMYMDSGEKLDSALEQVDTLSKKAPFMFFFDIICTPNQLDTAKQNALDITAEIRGMNNGIQEAAIVVGVTTKDKERTAQTLLQRIASQYKGDKLAGMKLNDGRHFIFVGGELRNG